MDAESTLCADWVYLDSWDCRNLLSSRENLENFSSSRQFQIHRNWSFLCDFYVENTELVKMGIDVHRNLKYSVQTSSSFLFELHQDKRLFQRSSNVIWTLWTWDGRWNNVMCQLRKGISVITLTCFSPKFRAKNKFSSHLDFIKRNFIWTFAQWKGVPIGKIHANWQELLLFRKNPKTATSWKCRWKKYTYLNFDWDFSFLDEEHRWTFFALKIQHLIFHPNLNVQKVLEPYFKPLHSSTVCQLTLRKWVKIDRLSGLMHVNKNKSSVPVGWWFLHRNIVWILKHLQRSSSQIPV